MTTHLYFVSYLAIARNVSPTALATALAAIPRDTTTETIFGLENLADVTSVNAQWVTRSMTFTAAPGAIVPDPGSLLSNQYTTEYNDALSTEVIASPVSSIVVPAVPLLWVRGDAVSGSDVSTWPDLSGHANNLVTTGADPSLSTDPFTGLPVVLFFDACLKTTNPITLDAYTYALTFNGPLASTPGYFYERSANATANPGENLYSSAGGGFHTVTTRRAAVTATADATANWAITGTGQMAASVYSHTGGGAVFNDDMTTPIASYAALGVQAAAETLFVGARTGVVTPWTGTMRELMVFNVALSTPELEALAAYMKPQVGL